MCFLCKNKCLTPEVLFMLCKKASELLYWYGSKQPIYLEFPLVFWMKHKMECLISDILNLI